MKLETVAYTYIYIVVVFLRDDKAGSSGISGTASGMPLLSVLANGDSFTSARDKLWRLLMTDARPDRLIASDDWRRDAANDATLERRR